MSDDDDVSQWGKATMGGTEAHLHGGDMYETPTLELYGTFRELTRIGKSGMMDQASVFNNDNTTNNDGCHGWTPTPSMTECYSG